MPEQVRQTAMNLVRFYRSEARDSWGRTLQEIWGWDDNRLEEQHDYIQVLFPLQEASGFNRNAPLLDETTIATFRSDATIQANLLRSFRVMLRFYGFRLDDKTGEVVEADHFAERARQWLFPNDHNHLRITRILKCLTLCGLGDRAAAFLRRLETVADPADVTAASLRYWRDAANREP
jgi:Opioid growth factor receptor (OGFr) conserved region